MTTKPKDFKRDGSNLAYCPPVEKWDDWVELDPEEWPRRVEKHFQIVPTVCFNCESACGLLAYVDKQSGKIEKFEGNPMHPASRGRLCAKGPATINQIHDPDRILYPMKRNGPRGGGQWTRTSWDEVLETFGARIRKAFQENRGEEVMYHVGRPGHDYIMERTLQAWGIDGHNSHTNVCSSSARLGYLLWHYADRPSPDHANARFILLLSAHLESGHYFNPHAQRIIEGKMAGAKLAVVDPRLSNTASMADYWLPSYPGTEGAMLLAMAKVILDENRYDAEFVKNWTNWEELEVDGFSANGQSFNAVIDALKRHYANFTPEFAEKESGVKAEVIVKIAREIATAGSRFASHLWRGSASGNLGGWQPARALMLLHVLTGSVGTEGGHNLNAWNKFVPKTFQDAAAAKALERIALSAGVAAVHARNVVSAAALPERRPRPPRSVFHARLQSRVDLSRRLLLDRNAARRKDDRPARRPHPHLERDRLVCRLRAAHGLQLRAARPDEPGILRRKVDRLPPAGGACAQGESRRKVRLHLSGQSRRSVGGRRILDQPLVGHRSGWLAWAFASGSNRRIGPGRRLTVDEYYGWIFENSVPGLPEAARAKKA